MSKGLAGKVPTELAIVYAVDSNLSPDKISTSQIYAEKNWESRNNIKFSSISTDTMQMSEFWIQKYFFYY